MTDQTPLEHRTAEICVDATPEDVYDSLADIQRMGRWSPDVDWVDFTEGYKETAEGAKFQGRNQKGPVKWTSDCKVRTARRGEELAWDVLDGEWPMTRWRFQMHPYDSGTQLQQTVEILHLPATTKMLWLLQGGQESRLDRLEANMQETLERVKEDVEQEQPAAVAS